MKEIEIVDKRGPKEKHFLQENGEFRAEMYDENIHYFNNGKFEEIDNTLILEDDHYVNKANENKVLFTAVPKPELMRIEKDNHFISFSLKDYNQFDIVQEESMSKLIGKIKYINVLKNVDICYDLVSSRVKESIYIKDKDSDIDKLVFKIDTDLDLKLENDSIIAMNNDECVFKFEVPFMMDSSGELNINVEYELNKIDNSYELKTILDKEWLNSNIKYPVIIDPSITNYSNTNSVIDTYIFPNDTNIDRDGQLILKVGVDKVNNVERVNRTLLKFDLPAIGTGSQIINAKLNLNGYPTQNSTNNDYIIDVYRLTNDWQETTANWNNMNNNYDSTRIEAVCCCTQIYNFMYGARTMNASFDLTNLVKKWYTDTPNYGIVLKENNEIYRDGIIPTFYAKNPNSPTVDPKPILIVTYRNQSGIEKYMNYDTQSLTRGKIYQNNYNGNMVSIFDICSTINSKDPIKLFWVCNTNDVILNRNSGVGKGGKLNFFQTIETATEINTENIEYLKYYDEDGTIHYFPNKKTTVERDNNGNYNSTTVSYTDEYYDEDGLQLKIKKFNDYYIMYDKNNNQKIFTKINNIGYLSSIITINGKQIDINYDSNNRIISIIDSTDNETISISYENNLVTITSPNDVTVLGISNNNMVSISNKYGDILFTYNNDLIETITDLNNKKIAYEYYSEIPFRVKKVSEYGTNGLLGTNYTITYGYNCTTLIDSLGRAKTITFNDFGNPISISTLKNHNDITNAYGMKVDYNEYFEGSTLQNKLLGNQLPLKYVRNYLSDSSFESGVTDFVLSDNNSYMNITYDEACSGLASLKVQTGNYGVGGPMKSVPVPKGKYYTFSAFVKALYQPLYMKIYYSDAVLGNVQEICEITPDNANLDNNGFERYDVSIFYSENATSNLNIMFLEGDTYYIDDVQLEEGPIVNNYNMLENAGFENGMTGWTLTATDENNNDVSSSVFEIVNVVDNTNALKVKCNPSNRSKVFQSFNIKGNEGDKFTISFWYKNEGFLGGYGIGNITRNNITLKFNPVDVQQTDLMITSNFNPNEKEWQFFSYTVDAPWDFDGMVVEFWQELNANNLYITNLNLFKDVRNTTYEYDENGKIISTKNLSNGDTKFKYDNNNQLIKITTPIGKNFIYEYDNVNTDRILTAISEKGIANEIEYDSSGKPIITRIINKYKYNPLDEGNFEIRIKGTKKYIGVSDNNVFVTNDSHNHNTWIVEKVVIGSRDYYKISSYIINNKFLTITNSDNLVLSNYNSDYSLFELIKKDNNSFLLKNKGNQKYLKFIDDNLSSSEYEDGNSEYEFYFENIADGKFIEKSIEYSENGNFIKSTTDDLLNKTYYDVDEETGLIKSIKNPKGIKVNYEYNQQNQVVKATIENNSVIYTYNSNNMISKISQGNKEYNIEYDEFLNIKKININNNTLVTNNYGQNNGNLLSTTYGNDDIISYTYDDFNRTKSVVKMDNTYDYYYDNNGNLAKIIGLNDISKYQYDSSKRLYKYSYNNSFIVKYGYDISNNIVSLNYKLDNILHNVNNTFGKDGLIEKTIFDNVELNYEYDSLSRLISSNISNMFNVTYEYESDGYRASNLIKSINNNGDVFSYKYDKNGNIIAIYHNNRIVNKYYYDCYDEIVREDDYEKNQTIRYKYDKNGNILFKKVYEIDTYNQISQNIYEYSNSNWCDQLTKFNNDIITYDEIGNPLTIGSSVLTWTNGRQLCSYSDQLNAVSYNYNESGIRNKKVVNNVITEYLLSGNEIIFENRAGNMLYYLRNTLDGLLGFIYNNTKYYYIKNKQNDIIGIMDDNFSIIAKYEYDSWGKIISVLDNNNNDISNDYNHIANINPYRYRSYYYDVETKYYYLNNRYYNPEWGRFLNADNTINSDMDLLSHNLYIYCGNNPINRVDESGSGFFDILVGVGKFVVKTVTKTVAKVVKKVANVVGKTINYIVNNLDKSFNFSAGVGFGADVGVNGAKIGYYNDKTVKISNGEIKDGNEIYAGAKVGVSKNAELNGSVEVFHTPHIVPGHYDESISHTQFMPLMEDVAGCEHSEVSIGSGFNYVESASATASEDTFFFGIDISLHFGVGGHFKIGFDIPWSIY